MRDPREHQAKAGKTTPTPLPTPTNHSGDSSECVAIQLLQSKRQLHNTKFNSASNIYIYWPALYTGISAPIKGHTAIMPCAPIQLVL